MHNWHTVWLLRNSCLLILFNISLTCSVFATNPLHIYLDADRTDAIESTIAIERGIRTALHEVDNHLAGHPVKLITFDHQSNSARSRQHFAQYLDDPHALVVFAGLHSPPLLANLTFINQNNILTLVPWAAAGPITRYANGGNWIYRLSIDDSKAGYVISRYAIKQRQFKMPHLLLERTGWGKANAKVMKQALQALGQSAPRVTWFNWGITVNKAHAILRTITRSNTDVIFFVGNTPEGKVFAQAMLKLPAEQRLPIASHWGITGGDFPSVINADMRKKLDLAFIQTRFSFFNMANNAFAQTVFKRAQQHFPELQTVYDLKAPVGFIHAYDLTRILIAAAAQAEFTDDMSQNRIALRHALENLSQPVQGLLKTYQRPFSAFSPQTLDAHEALGIEDFTMGRYGEKGEILLY